MTEAESLKRYLQQNRELLSIKGISKASGVNYHNMIKYLSTDTAKYKDYHTLPAEYVQKMRPLVKALGWVFKPGRIAKVKAQ